MIALDGADGTVRARADTIMDTRLRIPAASIAGIGN
jgi:hypothetical protein